MSDNSKSQEQSTSDSLELAPPVGDAASTESGTNFNVVGGVDEGGTYEVIDPVPTRDIAIAGVAILVAVALFFMLKRAFELWCVNRRVSPNKAQLAGNSLFVGLTLLIVAVALFVLDPTKFGVMILMGPLLGIALIALLMAAISARR